MLIRQLWPRPCLDIKPTNSEGKMSSKLLITAAVLAFCVLIQPARADVILLSDNFDAENSGNPQLNYFTFANFDVTAGSVDLIGNGYFDAYSSNGLYLDSAGSTGQPG